MMNPKVLNPILSIFDREARKIVARIAEKIPEDSFLRSEIFGRAFDVFRGALEGANFGSLTPIVEKLTDYGDALAEDLTGENTKKTNDTLQGWMSKFLVEANGRLAKAADPAAELEKITAEFSARMQLLRLIEAEAEKYAEEKKSKKKTPDAPPLEIGKKLQKFLCLVKNAVSRTAEGINQTADGLAEPLESLNKTLSKRAGARKTDWECHWFDEPEDTSKGGSK
ncbi:MAG: hypothetical protein WC609_02400 [Candidatus Paceibacterota bacterium]